MRLPVVLRLVNDGSTFPLAPCKFHPATGDRGFGAGQYHGGLGDGDAGIKGKGLAFFLLACVDGTWKMGVYACVELSHVIVDVWLQDGRVGGLDVCDKITQGDRVESFDWVIKCGIVDVVDRGRELIARDGRDDKVSVPCFSFGEVGCLCCFAGRNCGRSVDGVIRGGCCGDGECCAVALQVED